VGGLIGWSRQLFTSSARPRRPWRGRPGTPAGPPPPAAPAPPPAPIRSTGTDPSASLLSLDLLVARAAPLASDLVVASLLALCFVGLGYTNHAADEATTRAPKKRRETFRGGGTPCGARRAVALARAASGFSGLTFE
jgi:hypothetical protein